MQLFDELTCVLMLLEENIILQTPRKTVIVFVALFVTGLLVLFYSSHE